MTNPYRIEYRKCEDAGCGRPVYSPNRIHCWRCLNSKRLWGGTYSEVTEKKRQSGQVCGVCERKAKAKEVYKNKVLCIRCWTICKFLENQKFQSNLVQLMTE